MRLRFIVLFVKMVKPFADPPTVLLHLFVWNMKLIFFTTTKISIQSHNTLLFELQAKKALTSA